LKEIAEIPVGLQTSADQIYIFEPIGDEGDIFLLEKDGLRYSVEKAICLPCVYDLSFQLFDQLSPNAQIIFPYTIKEGVASVISEEQMKADYPLCWAYLSRHKDRLSKRSINGGGKPTWYQYGRSQSLTKFHEAEKIIFPVLSKEPSYAVDLGNLQFTGGGNGPYYSIIPKSSYSIYYLLALLSHPVLEAMVKSRASEFRGEYYSHGKQFIENIPIRKIDFENAGEKRSHDTIAVLVQELISTKSSLKKIGDPQKKQVLRRKTKTLHTRMIELIDELYKFSEEELNSITGNNLFVA
jgi:hypothetical protein